MNGSSIGKSNDLKKLATGASSAFIGRILGSGLIFLYQVILIRYLPTDSAGQFLWYTSIILLLATIARFGLDSAVLKLVAVNAEIENWKAVKGILRKAVYFVLVSGSLISCVSIYVSDVFYEIDNLTFKIASISIPFVGLMWIMSEALRALKEIKKSVLVQFVWVGGGGILLLAASFFWGGRTEKMAAIAMVITYSMAVFLGFLFIIQTKKVIVSHKGSISSVEMIRISIPMFIVNMCNQWMASNETILLGKIARPEIVAYYVAAFKTTVLVTIVLMAVNSMLSPMVAVAHTLNEKGRLTILVETASDWSLLGATPVVVLLILLSNTVLSVFGDEYTYATVPLIILALGQWFNSLCGPGGNLFGSTVLQKDLAVIVAISALFSLCVGIILILKWEIIGAAISAALSIITWNTLIAIIAWRRLRVRIIARRWQWPAIFIVLSLTIFTLSERYVVFSSVFFPTLMLVSYCFVLMYFVLSVAEKKLIYDLVK